MASDENLHGAQGISELCQRLGPAWTCQGSETSTGFFVELLKSNATPVVPRSTPRHCPSLLLTQEEQRWRFGTRAFAYCLGLAYCFLGLAVITRVYMRALDSIVRHSRKSVHRDPITGLRIFSERRIWNPTVADITLLALGTCAPQVSLAVIDAFQHIGQTSGSYTPFSFFFFLFCCSWICILLFCHLCIDGASFPRMFAELGAGTLLGSTAFNLFLILAVCVVAPKRFQTKSIRNVGVYIIEVVWSFWAYVWLFLILEIWTPNEITLWEAVLTVAQFPLLVLHAYVQDRNWKYLSIPLRESDAIESSDMNNLHELANVSRSSKFAAMRTWRGIMMSLMADISKAPSRQLRRQRSCTSPMAARMFSVRELVATRPHNFRLFFFSSRAEDVDTSSRDNFAFLREGAETEHFSWKALGTAWKNQFYDAMTVASIEEGRGQRKRTPSTLQLLLHPIVSYWKVSFAFIPPVQLLHGWLAFLGSICFITWISYVVVALSNRINCVTGISSYVLALTVLAAGTSLPNLMASKIAAEEYDTADSAIANINASNCINVYVGFGVPWCVSALYSTGFHQNLVVPVEGLKFLLSVYFSTAITCFVALTARRRLLGGELGGPRKWAWASAIFFFLLWITFLTLACLAGRFT
ncbi:magnesium/proton exchanger isoform X2 [Selaginella moellendorffii]|uniref:magnesium/proton exchanger isoform X2 n=1 Tax=Selaginella moellendorffii TaxID=88036 RepID=UPI000D1CD4AD|nr:magnesium/proton exchanger isoform X2 [Selaginella moellendorffii]|eukprot:XP_024526332.1 magnesium/proton exchanger isoform X2 [Selaginella moellendorffii]